MKTEKATLNADFVKAVREQMGSRTTVKINEMIIHPSWFLHKDGTPMSGERRMKRYAAIKQLIRIRLRRVKE